MPNEFDDLFAEAEAAFDGEYKNELDNLLGLSREEIDAVTPGTSDLKIYDVLISVVKKASKDNISQAQLIDNIRSLGEVAVKIAKKVQSFAALLI